jgi:DUF1680 family protein
MSINRREFLGTSVKTGTLIGALQSLSPSSLLAAVVGRSVSLPVTAGRMAYTPASAYRPYISKLARKFDAVTWIQIDLGSSQPIDSVTLYPAVNLDPSGFGFPVRFKMAVSNDGSFAVSKVIADYTNSDFPNPGDQILQFPANGVQGRYVRLSATQLRPSPEGVGFFFALSKVDIVSGGKDIAQGRPVIGDETYGNDKDFAQVTRAMRPQGEGIVTDNPENVIPLVLWKPVAYRASAPMKGVSLEDGVFRKAMEDNIGYLLRSFSVEEMLRPFRERAGKPVRHGLREPVLFWDTDLPGSNAGRFLMGAGNTLRWTEHDELRGWLNELVDGIEECRAPNGYIMAYPEDSIFHSERAAYTRAWLTHGLIEAGYAGNAKAFELLRSYYEWFDHCPYLPKLLRGAGQGVQGMIANTRMYFTPVGKPEDIQVVQRYFQENYWLKGLRNREEQFVWQYPYDQPHNYLITDFEAYLDLYRATGDKLYLDAVQGAWELFHDNWEHVGGSIAITELGDFPPKSYRLVAQHPFCDLSPSVSPYVLCQPGFAETGETCGTVFWTLLNQRLHLLFPEEEKYVNEIEKSIYNVGLANQVGTDGIIYHARLVGKKGEVFVPLCTNSCCEGQGTRLLGSLPEYIYSLSTDGLYINLFHASIIRWSQSGSDLSLKMSTRFPLTSDVQLRLSSTQPVQSKIRLRVPAWAAKEMQIRVNGEVSASGKPGSFVTLDRTWRDGDVIAFTLPMEFKMTRYSGLDKVEGHERFALEYGPLLLALVGSDNAVLKVKNGNQQEDIIKQLKADPNRQLRFKIDGHPEYLYMPYWEVLNEPFTCYPVIDLS